MMIMGPGWYNYHGFMIIAHGQDIASDCDIIAT